jgi:hypothetical protein
MTPRTSVRANFDTEASIGTLIVPTSTPATQPAALANA